MKYRTGEARSWVRESLRGYVAITTTPMSAGGEIDESGIRNNVDKLLELPGVTGLYLNSLYQEFWTMTPAERRRVAEVTLDAVAGRGHVIVGCNGTSAREVTDAVNHAEEHGADLVMVWPPYYGVRTRAGVRAYYEHIAAGTNIGMCVYSTTLPELGHHLTAEAVLELSEIDNICAVKEVSLSLAGYSEIMAECGNMLSISSPFEEYHFFGKMAFPDVVPDFLLGSSRPLYMQTPQRPLCKEYFDAITEGRIDEARKALLSILEVANKLHSKYLARGAHNVALTKHLTSLFGLAAGPVRPPMSPPEQADVDEAVAILTAAGLLIAEPVASLGVDA